MYILVAKNYKNAIGFPIVFDQLNSISTSGSSKEGTYNRKEDKDTNNTYPNTYTLSLDVGVSTMLTMQTDVNKMVGESRVLVVKELIELVHKGTYFVTGNDLPLSCVVTSYGYEQNSESGITVSLSLEEHYIDSVISKIGGDKIAKVINASTKTMFALKKGLGGGVF